MYPFAGGILSSLDATLLVPGQDSQATFQRVASGSVYSGLYFRTTGILERRNAFSTYAPALTNSWIHEDSQPFVDPNDYEARFIYQSGSGLVEVKGSAENQWISCHLQPGWYANANSTFETITLQGLIQVRQKTDVGNIRTGDVIIRAIEIGL